VAGLVIAVISLTGSVIVFRTELELASVPRPSSSGPSQASVSQVVAQVAQTNPGAQIRQIHLPAKPGDPFVVQVTTGNGTQRLVCDGSTGRVLGVENTAWVSWMIDLHRNLLAAKTGRQAVGIFGIVLFTLAATGMLLWLSGARKWSSWVSVRPGGMRRFNFELHRAVGLWSYVLLTVLAFTGIGLAFPETFRSTLQAMTGSEAPAKSPKVSKSASAKLLGLDEYLRAGAAAMPDGVPVELRLPDGGKGAKNPIDLRLWRTGDLAPDGNHVYMEPATAKVLSVSRIADQPLAARIFGAFSPIHYGEFGGVTIKLIWCLIGLMPSVLLVTGFLTWLRPKKPQTAKRVPAVREEAVLQTVREAQEDDKPSLEPV
jgi:uncharacterized iron-regulated membrane protein